MNAGEKKIYVYENWEKSARINGLSPSAIEAMRQAFAASEWDG